jgi:hypothetical protein
LVRIALDEAEEPDGGQQDQGHQESNGQLYTGPRNSIRIPDSTISDLKSFQDNPLRSEIRNLRSANSFLESVLAG